MAIKEPEVRPDIQLGDDLALAELSTLGADVGNPVQHQHVVERELRVARAEQFTHAAGDQFVPAVAVFHGHEGLFLRELVCGAF